MRLKNIVGVAVLIIAQGCSGESLSESFTTETAVVEQQLAASLVDGAMRALESTDADLNTAIQTIRSRPDAIQALKDVADFSSAKTFTSDEERVSAVRLRYKAVHLLGELRDPQVAYLLSKIASEELPNPESVAELVFSGEYKVRLRAIEGLENVGAVEQLRGMYPKAGLLQGAVAASLYELGAPPKELRVLNPGAIFDKGDPTDYNLSKKARRESRATPTADMKGE